MSLRNEIQSCNAYFSELFLAENLTEQLIFTIFVNNIFDMEKINRLTFLRRTGISAAALAVGAYGKAEANTNDAATKDGVATDVVSVGTKVTVKDLDDGEITEYLIVGSTEADPMKGKISDESPVGNALLGHKIGEVVVVEAPMGKIEYEIQNISK